MISTQLKTLAAADCEIAFDDLTRQLYATDASLYQIEPAAVAFPRSAQQASSIISAAADANVPVTPRGAGSGLSRRRDRRWVDRRFLALQSADHSI